MKFSGLARCLGATVHLRIALCGSQPPGQFPLAASKHLLYFCNFGSLYFWTFVILRNCNLCIFCIFTFLQLGADFTGGLVANSRQIVTVATKLRPPVKETRLSGAANLQPALTSCDSNNVQEILRRTCKLCCNNVPFRLVWALISQYLQNDLPGQNVLRISQ